MIVFLGGGAGAAARYLVTLGIDRLAGGGGPGADPGFPYGTLTVNLIGSAAIGIVGGLILTGGVSEDDAAAAGTLWKLGVVVGVLGGFTTMSSFAADAVKLAEGGRVWAAIVYGVLTNVGCVVAAATGGLAASRLAS